MTELVHISNLQNTLKLDNWWLFKTLVEEVEREAHDTVNVNFDLVLTEVPTNVPHLQPPDCNVQATAITIQEGRLASVLAAEQAGSGYAVAIRERWRCNDSYCSNHL
jgi:hypothetical protein